MLVDVSSVSVDIRSTLAIERHRAAIFRHDLSRPVRLALSAGVLKRDESFFDYGCGHAEDVTILSEQGYKAAGWDPHYFPQNDPEAADVVNLGYVLNVIENEKERSEALIGAWNLTRKLLIVAVQVWVGDAGKGHLAYNDGFITSRNTFQKYFEQQELKNYIRIVLGKEAVPAGLGIYFVFQDEEHAEAFSASRFRTRTTVSTARFSVKGFEEYLPVLQPLIDFVSERGRLPATEELASHETIRKEFRTIARAFEIIKRFTNIDEWQRLIAKHQQDLLVYIALSRFQRRPQISALPISLQLDIKAFFKTYRNACDEGDQLLFSLGEQIRIAKACRESGIGKFVGNALYVHSSALNYLSPVLRVYEGCASRTFGQSEQATIIKLRADKPKVSYLYYPDFDTDPHPALHSSIHANLSNVFVSFRDYSASENPPILHRKETFVTSDHPLHAKFAKLTAQEDKLGLLEDSTAIGNRKAWLERLNVRCLKLRGHRVLKIKCAS